MDRRPTVAIHKFSSCDGCQLAFLNLGGDLLELARQVDIQHFAEAGPLDPDASVAIAFVEGSISTPDDVERIHKIRTNSNYLITIGACATTGGLQALRNMNDTKQWIADIYASPEYISSLDTSTPISAHVKVDLELWGCPVNRHQVVRTIRTLLFGVVPEIEYDKVCLDCKRNHTVCVLVARGEPCLGPVTQTGCGALCPGHGRDCYACYGPAENINMSAMANRLQELGLSPADITRRFHFINSGAGEFLQAGLDWKAKDSDD